MNSTRKGQIKNPSYSTTRVVIREYVLSHVVEFQAELDDLMSRLIKRYYRHFPRQSSHNDIAIRVDNPEAKKAFLKRWKVLVDLNDQLEIQLMDMSNPEVTVGEINALVGVSKWNPNDEFILIPREFSNEEARKHLSMHLIKPKGYSHFKNWEELDEAILFHKLVRYDGLSQTGAIKRIYPNYNYLENEDLRKRLEKKLESIEIIIDFPPDLLR